LDAISDSVLFGMLVVLILFSAYFSSSETSMMSINRYRLRHMVKQKHKGARRVEKMLNRPDRLIGLILIGNNMVNLLAAAIATILGQRLLGHSGTDVAITTGLLTIAILIFAEVTPKTIAALYPERIAFPSSLILKPLMFLFYPLVWLVNLISNGILRLLNVTTNNDGSHALNTDELRSVVHEAGSMIPQSHQNMLLSILELEKVDVEDIMVPRNEIVGIDINDDWDDILKQLTHSAHTKILLFRDNIDDAVGFVHARDALRLLAKDNFDKTTLLKASKKLYFIPEGTPLNVQLQKFQGNNERTGLVVDEYGDIQGLITLADILEEIVGDFTTGTAPDLKDELQIQEDGSYLIDGSSRIRDINKETSWKLPTNGPSTINGLILEYLEDIPEKGVCLRLGGYPLEVLEVENNMVKQIKVLPNLYQEEDEEEEN